MALKLGSLEVEIGADTQKLDKGVGKANKGLSKLQAEVNATRTTFDGLQKEITDTEASLDGLGKEAVATRTKLGGMEKKLIGARFGLIAMEKEAVATRASLDGLKDKTSIAGITFDGLARKAGVARDTFEGLKRRASATRDALGRLEKKTSNARTSLGGLEKKAAATRTSLGGMEKKAITAAARLGGMEQKAKATRTSISGLEKKTSVASTTFDRLQKKAVANRASLDRMGKTANVAGSGFSAMELKAKVAGNILERLKKKTIATRETLERLEKRTAATRDTFDGMVIKSSNARTSLGGLKKEAAATRTSIGGMEKKLIGARVKLGGMEKQTNAARTSLGGMEKTASVARTTLDGLEKEVTATRTSLGGMEKKAAKARTTFDGLKKKTSNARTSLGGLKKEAAAARTSLGGLKEKASVTGKGLGKLEKKAAKASASLAKMNAQARKTSKGLTKVEGQAGLTGRAFGKLASVIALAISFETIRRTILLADSLERLDARIKDAARTAKDFRIIRQGIRDIAIETGGAIESIGNLAQGILLAGENMGITADQAVEVTESLGKLGIIGGTAAADMTRAMVQFNQAMGSGTLRAEEFNSIIEAAPAVVRSIAKGMGITAAEFRNLVKTGGVSSKVVFDALLTQTDSINERFLKMPISIQRATGSLKNQFAVAVQDINVGLEITASKAISIQNIADIVGKELVPFVDDLVIAFKTVVFQIQEMTKGIDDNVFSLFNMESTFGLIKDGVKFVFDAILNLIGNVSALSTIISGELSKAWITAQENFVAFTKVIETSLINAFDTAITKIKTLFGGLTSGIQNVFAAAFEFAGADKVAESLRVVADVQKEIGAELNEALEEQKALRLEQLEAELEANRLFAEQKREIANLNIESAIAETEAVKAQVAARIKAFKDEIAARRVEAKTGASLGEKQKKIEKTKTLTLKQTSATIASLNAAGLVNSKVNAVAQVGISVATAIAKTSELGFPQAIPFIAQAIAVGASALSMLNAPGRRNGGFVSGNLPIPVNEGGNPELFERAGRQFLLSKGSGEVIPLQNAGSGRGSTPGNFNITVINETPIQVEPSITFVTQNELMIRLRESEQQVTDSINGSLASGRGQSANSLRQGFSVARNI